MGKFNWRGAAQGALGSLYQSWEEDQNQKREYTRQDRDLAQQLYAKMLESGMTPPDMPALGPMAEELAKSYRDQLPQAKQKALDEEMDKIYQQETARGLAQSQFEKPEKESEYEKFINGSPEYKRNYLRYKEEVASATRDPAAMAQLEALRGLNLSLAAQRKEIGELNLREKKGALAEKEGLANRMSKAVDDIYTDWLKVPLQYKGVLQGRVTEAQLQGLDNPAVKRFMTKKKALGLKVAKMLEGSRMSDQDRAFYLDLVLDLKMENPETAKANVEGLKWFFTQMYTKGDIEPGERPPEEVLQGQPTSMTPEEYELNLLENDRGGL